jgi:hypothetical protein
MVPAMFKQIIFPILLIALLPLILKLMLKLRLGIAIAYVVLGNTLLMDWATANVTRSNGILFGILGLTALSWLVTLYRKAGDHFGFSCMARQQERLLAAQLRAAHADGVAPENICIQVNDGVPVVKYQ